jgi:hypothetical protein
MAGNDLLLRYRLRADSAALRLPAFDRVRRGDRLWEHTCFEAFAAVEDRSEYLELNFAPTGEWAAYGFTAYREDMTPTLAAAPEIAVSLSVSGLDLAVRVDLQGILPRQPRLRLGLCAVIEDAGGALSYWALRHPCGKPDFHRRDAFVLGLDLPPAGPSEAMGDRVT